VPKKQAASKTDKKVTYESFLRSVKLYSLAMDDLTVQLDREKYWDRSRKPDDRVREIGATYETRDVEGDHFDVLAKYELKIGVKGEKNAFVRITCTYSAHFHAATDCNGEYTERFAKSEARIIIWPYFRSLVSDLSGRMHIPPILIPLALD
jgi:hypothetical protein